MTAIKIQTRFEHYHRWLKAPKTEAFLRNLHRHLFYVVVIIDVSHNDRNIEFFRLSKEINVIIANLKRWNQKKGYTASCEDMAEYILDHLELSYIRPIQVEVLEDNENGGIKNNYESYGK